MVKDFCLTAFVSLVLFYIFNISEMSTIFYVAAVGVLWILILLQYRKKDNIDLFIKLFVVAISNFSMFLFMKFLNKYRLLWDIEDWVGVVYGILLFFLLIACVIYRWMVNRTPKEEEEKPLLFLERVYDKERLEKYLEKFPCVGVQALWGNGKSFLVDHLETDTYLIIKIDLLTCNLDEIQMVLLSEIDKALKENGIFSSYSPKLGKMLRQNKVGQTLGQLFVQDDISYSDAIAGFRRDLRKLQKKVLIVYEDLDRIESSNIIKKILGISEKIAGDDIQIIYQYDEKKLNEKLEGGREYIEKYIPVTVNLTELPWEHILDYLLEKRGSEYFFDKKDFQFLKFPLDIPHFRGLQVSSNSISIIIPNVTIRKMENFLDELDLALKNNSGYSGHKKIVIVFFLIKNFYSKIYDMLKPGESLLNTFLFHYNEKEDNILNWYQYFSDNKGEEISKLLHAQENQESLLMISLLGYHCDIYEGKLEMEDIINVPKDILEKRNNNEKIDRIIWNLLCNGKSEYTDYERFVKRLDECVFSKPFETWKKEFEKLWDDIFYGCFEVGQKRDNRTIFRLGKPSMLSVFQALRASGANKLQWKNILDFYNEYYNKEQSITVEWIECINYCDINDREIYLYVMKIFKGLEIRNNLNTNKSYQEFLKEYLSAMSRHGYINTEEVAFLRNNVLNLPEDVSSVEKDILDPFQQKLERLKEIILVPSMKEEVELLIQFIEHNKKLISAFPGHERCRVRIKTKFESVRTNKKVYNRLETEEMTDEDFAKEVEMAYNNCDLTMHEAEMLFEKRNRLE